MRGAPSYAIIAVFRVTTQAIKLYAIEYSSATNTARFLSLFVTMIHRAISSVEDYAACASRLQALRQIRGPHIRHYAKEESMSATILLIGSTRGKSGAYLNALQRHYYVLTAPSGRQAMLVASKQALRVIVVDGSSMKATGERVCRSVKDELPMVSLVHIHPGSRDTVASPADVILHLPLSARRLLTNVEQLVNTKSDAIIDCGPFSMNVSRRTVMAHGRETQLTPKQADLLETFMRHPGEIIDRKMLMETVWKTDYLGDTRTLDVHVRWIRKILETGNGKPRYLQTVRGVGYRLVLPDGS
jgi:DNA-binding response OmpR family regulator